VKPLVSSGFTRFQTRNFGLGELFDRVAERLVGADVGIDCHDVPASGVGSGQAGATQSGVGGQGDRQDGVDIDTALHIV
jgi:hypothetical protein